jgi:multicomponent Na+:H+ antiporter subunit C
MMIGFYAMIGKKNLVKKIVGLNIFQTAIILYFVSIATKKGATIPIVVHDHGKTSEHAIQAMQYVNPLPHVLMLTAIVVMVGTFGVALAFIIRIYREYGTLEEDEILVQEDQEKIKI